MAKFLRYLSCPIIVLVMPPVIRLYHQNGIKNPIFKSTSKPSTNLHHRIHTLPSAPLCRFPLVLPYYEFFLPEKTMLRKNPYINLVLHVLCMSLTLSFSLPTPWGASTILLIDAIFLLISFSISSYSSCREMQSIWSKVHLPYLTFLNHISIIGEQSPSLS